MTLQNLLYGLENGSFMDIKLGQDSLTVRGDADDEDRARIERKAQQDKERCTAEYGYTLVGVVLKNPKNGK